MKGNLAAGAVGVKRNRPFPETGQIPELIRLTEECVPVYFALQFYGDLAQSVEQRIENPRVPSSILGVATTFEPPIRVELEVFFSAFRLSPKEGGKGRFDPIYSSLMFDRRRLLG